MSTITTRDGTPIYYDGWPRYNPSRSATELLAFIKSGTKSDPTSAERETACANPYRGASAQLWRHA